MKDIPIFIVNFNRYKPVMDLTEVLLSRDYTNITIIDNNSEYVPLLEWYGKCPINVLRLNTNLGPGAIDHLPQYKPLTSTKIYVWTDGDVVPVNETPKDFIDHMVEIIKTCNIPKLGLSLKIDDLPDCNKHKNDVIKHESVFTTFGYFDTPYCRVYKAPTDTTFAVNTPGIPCGYHQNACRTGWPYTARHIPWYYDSENLPEDEKILRSKVPEYVHTHWSKKQ